jgi:PmbA protein
MTDYLKIAQDVVKAAAHNGLQVEAYIEDSLETQVQTGKGEVEKLSSSGSKGLGVRVIDMGRVGYAYTSDFSPDSIETTWKTAIELAAVSSPDENRKLPELQTISDEDLGIWDTELSTISTQEKINFLKQVEDTALAFDERVFMVPLAAYQDAIAHVYLANSNGFAGSYDRTVAVSFLMCIGRDENGVAEAFGAGVSNYFAELDAKAIGQEAAERVVGMLGGSPVPTQNCTVVLDPFVTAEMLGVISQALSAEAMQKKRSFLLDKLGQDVASDVVSLMDNGRMKRGLASAPFDAEGVPTSATRLIDEGVFQNVVHDTYTANKAGVKSTGNAQRNSHRGVPSLAMSNFYLQPGQKSRDEIIAGVDNGMYVTRIMQTGGIDSITGDCSMGAYGVWIENGKLTRPVSGVTIATTLQDLLRNISEVGNDLRLVPFAGAISAPTIRVDNVTVGGTG